MMIMLCVDVQRCLGNKKGEDTIEKKVGAHHIGL
jgi:hypothetical protein